MLPMRTQLQINNIAIMKKKLTFVFTILFSCTLSAQTISEYQKKQQDEMQKFQQANAEGINLLQKEYADYVSKRDAEWADYLRKEWEQFSVFGGKEMPLKPKPRTIPTYLPPAKPLIPQPNAPAIKPIIVSPVVVVPKPTPAPVVPICKPAEDVINGNTANINFYGRTFSIVYDAVLAKCALSAVNKEGITAFWESASASNYTPVVEKLQNAKSDMKINDYGYFLLTQKLAQNLYPANENTNAFSK